jgi:hypothetical protein
MVKLKDNGWVVIYNPSIGKLKVSASDIQDFQVIIPENEDADYWDTVKGLDGNYLYDINLYYFGGDMYFQYTLIDAQEYTPVNVTIERSHDSTVAESTKLQVKASKFLDWMYSDREDMESLGRELLFVLKRYGCMNITIKDIYNAAEYVTSDIVEGYTGEYTRDFETSEVELIDDITL